MRTRIRLFLLCMSIVLIAGCTLNTDYFTEYRGTNLLGSHGFDAAGVWATTTDGLNATAGTDYYMRWEHASDLTSQGLDVGPDGTSPTYRLEIKNLVPDGDFEKEGEVALTTSFPGAMPTAGWSTEGGSKVRISSAHADNGLPSGTETSFSQATTISHRSLLFAAQDQQSDRVLLSLDTALGTALWQPAQYRIRFDFINSAQSQALGIRLLDGAVSPLPLENSDADDAGIWDQTGLQPIGTPATVGFSQTFTVSSTSDQRDLRWGSANAQDATLIDNLRVLLASQDLSAQMEFPSLRSGKLQLLPGTKAGAYVFEIKVRDDPTADQTSAAHVLNRFYATNVTITVEGKAKNTPALKVLAKETFERPSGGWATWTTFTLKGGLDFVDSNSDLDGQPALRIRITPTIQGQGQKDVGSILIAQPVLTYNP